MKIEKLKYQNIFYENNQLNCKSYLTINQESIDSDSNITIPNNNNEE